MTGNLFEVFLGQVTAEEFCEPFRVGTLALGLCERAQLVLPTIVPHGACTPFWMLSQTSSKRRLAILQVRFHLFLGAAGKFCDLPVRGTFHIEKLEAGALKGRDLLQNCVYIVNF